MDQMSRVGETAPYVGTLIDLSLKYRLNPQPGEGGSVRTAINFSRVLTLFLPREKR